MYDYVGIIFLKKKVIIFNVWVYQNIRALGFWSYVEKSWRERSQITSKATESLKRKALEPTWALMVEIVFSELLRKWSLERPISWWEIGHVIFWIIWQVDYHWKENVFRKQNLFLMVIINDAQVLQNIQCIVLYCIKTSIFMGKIRILAVLMVCPCCIHAVTGIIGYNMFFRSA